MCKLINRKISGGHGRQNQIWKKKEHTKGIRLFIPKANEAFSEVHRACPTPIDRSPKNIEGFENILAEQKKARILKKMLPLKLKSWKRHVTKTGLETENDEQLQKIYIL